jgi:hypothetical protein
MVIKGFDLIQNQDNGYTCKLQSLNLLYSLITLASFSLYHFNNVLYGEIYWIVHFRQTEQGLYMFDASFTKTAHFKFYFLF